MNQFDSTEERSADKLGAGQPLRILHLEDKTNDHELVSEHLKAHGFQFNIVQAKTRGDFVHALERDKFNLILSDFSMPSFSGIDALDFARETTPETAFIFVSGTIGEERAVESLKSGATDYVLKDHLDRLGRVVERALREVDARRERQLTEEKLSETRARLERVLAQSPAVIYSLVVERSRSIPRFISENIFSLWGYTVEEALHPDWWNTHVHPNDREYALANLSRWSSKGATNSEYQFRRKDGVYRWMEDKRRLIRDAEGHPVEIAGVWTDITEKKQLEAQVLRSQRLESIGTLAGGIAHDLNNVLSPILISIDILKRESGDEKTLEILSIIESSAVRGAEMVKQVLSFARGMDGRRSSVQIKDIVNDIAKIVKESFPKNIRLKLEFGARLWPLQADPTQLHQVFINLCVNARDAMPNGGEIVITAENLTIGEHWAAMNIEAKAGPYLKIEIRDTGTGIPPEVIDRIFDPFFTNKDFGKGTGLGLSTSLAIVKSHGGFIQVHSEVGKGSCFRIYLPTSDGHDSPASVQNEEEISVGNGETILVVDDDAAVREITQQTLKEFGYNVLLAANGADAVSIYAPVKEEIDAVLTDMMMPVMDGPTMIKVLQRLNPRVKIIATSGIHGDRIAEDVGIKCFLPKPYSTPKLLSTLRTVLKEKA